MRDVSGLLVVDEAYGQFAPWSALELVDEDTPLALIEALNPDVLIKGADYTIDNIVGARHVLSYGGKVLTCELVPGKSTTRVVNVLRGKASNS